MPWARAPLGGSITGIEVEDGQIFAVVAAALVVLSYRRLRAGATQATKASWGLLAVAAVAIVITVVEITHLDGQEFVAPSVGLYVCGVGSVLVAIGAVANLDERS